MITRRFPSSFLHTGLRICRGFVGVAATLTQLYISPHFMYMYTLVCVNVLGLARLGSASVVLSAFEIFPHILVRRATLSPVLPLPACSRCKAVCCGGRNTQRRRTWAGGGYRPVTFVEMKLCIHIHTHTGRPFALSLPTTPSPPVGNKAPSVSPGAQLDTAVEPSCSPRTELCGRARGYC